MFDKEFYPTPKSVLELMQIDSYNKVVLEPSAGKGDIVDYVKSQGAKKVIAFENNKDLAKIVSSKCQLLGDDFLQSTADQISHINLIIMNPPFSNADKHINHAFEIAPDGCEVIALCNAETGIKSLRYRRTNNLIRNYGSFENLGSCFDTAERKTNVEIGLVKLYKPMTTSGTNFEGFYYDLDEDTQGGDNGIMKHDEVFALVQRHVGALKAFDVIDKVKKEMEYSLSPIGVTEISLSLGYKSNITNKLDFSNTIQKKSWNYIFGKMNLKKYVTSGVMKDINKFVEQQEKFPFTQKNIYKMFDIIVGTRQQTMNRALEEVIDNYTQYTHENRFGVSGWKTNSGYMLNKKFIVENMVRGNYGNSDILEVNYSGLKVDSINDLTKVLCNLTGSDYSKIPDIYSFSRKQGGFHRGVWYQWGFFEMKFFKKGTAHFKFKKDSDWYILNKAYGELKGFTLSDKYKK